MSKISFLFFFKQNVKLHSTPSSRAELVLGIVDEDGTKRPNILDEGSLNVVLKDRWSRPVVWGSWVCESIGSPIIEKRARTVVSSFVCFHYCLVFSHTLIWVRFVIFREQTYGGLSRSCRSGGTVRFVFSNCIFQFHRKENNFLHWAEKSEWISNNTKTSGLVLIRFPWIPEQLWPGQSAPRQTVTREPASLTSPGSGFNVVADRCNSVPLWVLFTQL